jgi:hypothetical protein
VKAESKSLSEAQLKTNESNALMSRSVLGIPQLGIRVRINRIYEHSNRRGVRNQLMQQPQPLRFHAGGELADARRIPPGTVEAGDEAKFDRISADREDDRDRRGCGLCSERYGVAARGDDHCYPTADKICCQRRQSIELTLSPAVFDRDVVAVNVADFNDALTKRRYKVGRTFGVTGR